MTNDNWWARVLASEPPAPAEQPQSYAAYQAAKPANGSSGSFIYSPTFQAAIRGQQAPRPAIYADSPAPKTLADYVTNAPDKFARRPGESAESWSRRISRVLHHLPAELAQALQAAIDQAYQAEQAQNHDQLRGQITAAQRFSGTGTGLYGTATPQQRAQILGSRHGGRQIAAQGHLASQVESLADKVPASGASVHAIIREREAALRGFVR